MLDEEKSGIQLLSLLAILLKPPISSIVVFQNQVSYSSSVTL